MAKDSPIPLPTGPLLAWAMANPDAITNAIAFLNVMYAMQVKLMRAGVSTLNQQTSLLVSDQNAILNLPILWPNGVPPDLASGSTLPQAVAMINLILQGERGFQQYPGSAP